MPPQQTTQEIELMIEHLAHEKNLGKLEQFFVKRPYLMVLFLNFSLVGIPGLFIALGGSPPLSLGGRIGLGCMSAILVGAGIWLLIHVELHPSYGKDSKRDRVGIYEQGLIYTKGNDLRAIRWDEIRSHSFHSNVITVSATTTLGLKDGSTAHFDYATGLIEPAVKQHLPSLYRGSSK